MITTKETTDRLIAKGIMNVEKVYGTKYNEIHQTMICKKLKGLSENKIKFTFNEILETFVPTSTVKLPLLPHYLIALEIAKRQPIQPQVPMSQYQFNGKAVRQ